MTASATICRNVNADKVFLGGSNVADAARLRPDPCHVAGLNYNDTASLDEDFGNAPLAEICGGIPDFSIARVKVVRA